MIFAFFTLRHIIQNFLKTYSLHLYYFCYYKGKGATVIKKNWISAISNSSQNKECYIWSCEMISKQGQYRLHRHLMWSCHDILISASILKELFIFNPKYMYPCISYSIVNVHVYQMGWLQINFAKRLFNYWLSYYRV